MVEIVFAWFSIMSISTGGVDGGRISVRGFLLLVLCVVVVDIVQLKVWLL